MVSFTWITVGIDIPLKELEEIQCGSLYCTTLLAQFTAGSIVQGWLGTESGQSALKYIPGEYRDTDGELLYLSGLGDLYFKDAAGNLLADFDRNQLCFKIDTTDLDWIGDSVLIF